MPFDGHASESLLSQCLMFNHKCMFSGGDGYKFTFHTEINSVAKEECHNVRGYLAADSRWY